MSPRFRCNTCGGRYEDPLADGSRYFHACPPVSVPGPQPDPTLPGFTFPTEHERANKRDENLLPGLLVDGGRYFGVRLDPSDPLRTLRTELVDPIRSRGAGTTQI